MDKLVTRSTVSSQFVDANIFPVHASSLQISELPLGGIIRIQGSSKDAAFRSAVKAALAVDVPPPENSTSSADVRLAWAGPNEFLCFCPLATEMKYEQRLSRALVGHFATVTLVSDSRLGLQITGTQAASFLSKGCAIDLHAASFGIGHTVTTRFAGLPAMLLRDEDGYVIYFDIGYVEFLMKWVVDGAEEFL